MATKNRRVATYLPPDVDEKFKEYKEQNSIDGDSEALINILRDYLGVTHQEPEVSYLLLPNLLKRVEALESENFVTQEQLSDFKNEVTKDVAMALARQGVDQPSTLTTGELAKRLNISNSTLSHWKSDNPKKGKTKDQILESTRAKDPDGIGWIFLKEENCFQPEREIPAVTTTVQKELKT